MAKRGRRRRRSWPKTILWTLGILVVLFIAIQFVPYGHDHSKPPGGHAFKWTDPQAKAIAKRACYDCHSDQTKWWWATKIAPVSWLAQHDVSSARAWVNFSQWDGAMSAAELKRGLTHGMPPLQYTIAHPNAQLSAADRQTLTQGFEASLAAERAGSQAAASQLASGGTQTVADAQPAATAQPVPTHSAAPSGPDPKSVIASACSSCHSPDSALYYHAPSAADAQALIDGMIQQGASLTSAQQKALVAYFTR